MWNNVDKSIEVQQMLQFQESRFPVGEHKQQLSQRELNKYDEPSGSIYKNAEDEAFDETSSVQYLQLSYKTSTAMWTWIKMEVEEL